MTGYSSIYVNSPSNWNGSDVINGDASVPGATTALYFNNYQVSPYPPLPVTYDLTSNSFSHVNVYGGGDNITLEINNADAAGVQSFNASGLGDKLVTAGSDARSVPYDSKRLHGRQHQRHGHDLHGRRSGARRFRSPAVLGMTR